MRSRLLSQACLRLTPPRVECRPFITADLHDVSYRPATEPQYANFISSPLDDFRQPDAAAASEVTRYPCHGCLLATPLPWELKFS